MRQEEKKKRRNMKKRQDKMSGQVKRNEMRQHKTRGKVKRLSKARRDRHTLYVCWQVNKTSMQVDP